MSNPNTVIGSDGKNRCQWCSITDDFFDYHDNEWGFPVDNDRRLFEKICLESFQSGLSWRTILAKRDNFRRAFDHFDFNKIAQYNQLDVHRLQIDKGIVRHRGKIEATINNAQRAQELINKEGSLAAFFWRYEMTADEQQSSASTSEKSIALSRALKKMGWKFVGPTTVYAFMQAMGLVNDHSKDCISWEQVTQARLEFTPPV